MTQLEQLLGADDEDLGPTMLRGQATKVSWIFNSRV